MNNQHAVFTTLVSEYQNLVYATCVRILQNASDAEDATQETFLKIFKSHSTVRSNLSSWVYQCAKNTAINMRRSSISRVKREDSVSVPLEQSSNCEHIELLEILDRALEELPEEQRFVIVEHYLLERSQRDLMKTLNISQPAVKKRIDKAMAQLSLITKRIGRPCALLVLMTGLRSLVAGETPSLVTLNLKNLSLVHSHIVATSGAGLLGTLWTTVLVSVLATTGMCVSAWIALPFIWQSDHAPVMIARSTDVPSLSPHFSDVSEVVGESPVGRIQFDHRVAGSGLYGVDADIIDVNFTKTHFLKGLVYKKSISQDDMGYLLVDDKITREQLLNFSPEGFHVPSESDVYAVVPGFLQEQAYRIDMNISMDGNLQDQRFAIAGSAFTVIEKNELLAEKHYHGKQQITVCLVWTDVDDIPVWDVSYAINDQPYIRFTCQLRNMHDLVLWGDKGAVIQSLRVQTMKIIDSPR